MSGRPPRSPFFPNPPLFRLLLVGGPPVGAGQPAHPAPPQPSHGRDDSVRKPWHPPPAEQHQGPHEDVVVQEHDEPAAILADSRVPCRSPASIGLPQRTE